MLTQALHIYQSMSDGRAHWGLLLLLGCLCISAGANRNTNVQLNEGKTAN